MTNITIPAAALEAGARAAVIFNGGDPDKELRLTLQGVTITQWQQVAPLVEAACRAILTAWPGMRQGWNCVHCSEDMQIILPLEPET